MTKRKRDLLTCVHCGEQLDAEYEPCPICDERCPRCDHKRHEHVQVQTVWMCPTAFWGYP